MNRLACLGLAFWLGVAPRAARAEDPPAPDPAAAVRFFETKIRPVLVQHCYKCHSAGAGKSRGDLLVDTRESIRAGGSRGPAVVPGDPDSSLLLAAIAHSEPDLTMPPKSEPLPRAIVD